MNDEAIFQDYYRCTFELTDRKSYQRVILPMVVGATPFNPDYSVGTERVCAIYITEGMLEDLIHKNALMIKEEQFRRQDPQLMKLWMDYKIMLELKR